MREAKALTVGSVVIDSLPFSSEKDLVRIGSQAQQLAGSGVNAVALYLGVANPKTIEAVLRAGMAAIPVTIAGEYKDGFEDELKHLKNLGFVQGTTVFLDVEGLSTLSVQPKDLIDSIENWAAGIVGAGFTAGIYLAPPQPLTSMEMWKLKSVTRYWKGMGSVRDRHNALAEPSNCGWCMTQMYPSYTRAGVLVDANMVGQDFKRRTPVATVAKS